MNSKKLIAAFSVCALLLVTAGFVEANSFTHNRYNNSYNLSPEKAASAEKIYDRGQAKIQPLRDNLYAKRLELNALAQNPNTKPATIKALAQDITELRQDIREQRDIMATSLEKETGMNAGYHRGGRGMMGGGGRGMMGGGNHGMMGGGMDCQGGMGGGYGHRR